MTLRAHKWKTDKPIQSGWYWAYEDYGEAYAIDFVRLEFRAQEPPLILSVEHGSDCALDFWNYWYGPMDVPELPKKLK